MKTKTPITVLLIAIVLASCAPTAASVPSTFTPFPPVTSIPPTERPRIVLKEDAVLYSGPGSADFDPLATLQAGESVYPLGTYADFVQVAANVEGKEVTGFIPKSDLGVLAVSLPELTADAVPLTSLMIRQCRGGIYDPQGSESGTQVFINKLNRVDVSNSPAVPLDRPLHVRMDDLQVTGSSNGSIQLFGRQGAQETWWQDTILLDIGHNPASYVLSIRDGTTENANFILEDLEMSPSETIRIIFEDTQGRSFQVQKGDGKLVRRVDVTKQPELNLPNGIFPNREVYIATSIGPFTTLSVTGLQIGVPPSGRLSEFTDPNVGLAKLAARHNLTIGTEFSIEAITDPRYCRVMHQHFNLVFIGGLTWHGTWLSRDRYDFSYIDQQVDFANRQGWRVRASVVYGITTAVPDWLKNGKFTRDEYIQILEQHVKMLVGRYKGRVQEWIIANEAVSRSCNACKGGTDFWNEKIGPEYIEMAFRWAREIDPDAILILNDTNNEAPRDRQTTAVVDRMYAKIKDLKSKGVPIDAVGMQMHLLVKYSSPVPPEKEAVLATMRKFADLGVKIYITEFDVDIHNRPGTAEEQLEFQADLYRDMLEACLESKACGSFTTWGVSDSTSWLTLVCEESWCMNQPDADPLMFDRDYNPKPAYFAVRDVLLNFSHTSPP